MSDQAIVDSNVLKVKVGITEDATHVVDIKNDLDVTNGSTDTLTLKHSGSADVEKDGGEDISGDQSEAPGSGAVEVTSSGSGAVEVTSRWARIKKRHLHQKVVFVLAVMTLTVLCMSVMDFHWFIPYYYTIATPILIITRSVLYWKNQWQYFLIDFCYFANFFCYVMMWAVPWSHHACLVLFAVSNGPLSWATVAFRNALVFHDLDRMTSCYIHILPMAFSFGLRWYPDELSLHWYTEFNTYYPEEWDAMLIWLLAVPLAAFMLHSLLYLVIVYGLCKPDDKYLNSLRYLSAKRNSTQGKVLYGCGEKYLLVTFTMYNLVYSMTSLLLTILFYKFFQAHACFIVFVLMIVSWNGATFYLDVFARKR